MAASYYLRALLYYTEASIYCLITSIYNTEMIFHGLIDILSHGLHIYSFTVRVFLFCDHICVLHIHSCGFTELTHYLVFSIFYYVASVCSRNILLSRVLTYYLVSLYLVALLYCLVILSHDLMDYLVTSVYYVMVLVLPLCVHYRLSHSYNISWPRYFLVWR